MSYNHLGPSLTSFGIACSNMYWQPQTSIHRLLFPFLLFALASCSIQNLNSWLFKVSDQWTLRKLKFQAWGWEHITLLVLITSWNYYVNIKMPDFRLLPLCSWDRFSGFCTALINSWFLMFQNSIQSHLQGSRYPSQGLLYWRLGLIHVLKH